jgi:sec-independent protein translocase protein TatA
MNSPVMLAMLGWPEIVGIAVIVLILFGAKKVPELMKGLGHGIKEFKKATRDVQDDIQRAMDDDPPPSSTRRVEIPPQSIAKSDEPAALPDTPAAAKPEEPSKPQHS